MKHRSSSAVHATREQEEDTAECIITGGNRRRRRRRERERLCSTANSHHHRYAAADDAFPRFPNAFSLCHVSSGKVLLWGVSRRFASNCNTRISQERHTQSANCRRANKRPKSGTNVTVSELWPKWKRGSNINKQKASKTVCSLSLSLSLRWAKSEHTRQRKMRERVGTGVSRNNKSVTGGEREERERKTSP